MNDELPDDRLPDEEVRKRLREFSKFLREFGLIGGPHSAASEYRASRAIRPDKFLDDVVERQRQRVEGEEAAGEDS